MWLGSTELTSPGPADEAPGFVVASPVRQPASRGAAAAPAPTMVRNVRRFSGRAGRGAGVSYFIVAFTSSCDWGNALRTAPASACRSGTNTTIVAINTRTRKTTNQPTPGHQPPSERPEREQKR